MVNNVIGMVNYVIATRPSLLNFVIADTSPLTSRSGARRQRLLAGSSARAASCGACMADNMHFFDLVFLRRSTPSLTSEQLLTNRGRAWPGMAGHRLMSLPAARKPPRRRRKRPQVAKTQPGELERLAPR
jgi:hypothetical protein